MTKAAIYCRLSQDRDGTKGGTDRQEKDCRALARREGIKVARVFTDDDRSAYSGKARPAFDQMLAELDTFDVLIYWKTDRLCRRAGQFWRVMEACEAAGVRLVSVVDPIDTSSPIGKGVAGMLASVGEQESHNTGRRVRRASDDRAAAGKPHGSRRPYGFTPDGSTIVEVEAKIVREAVRRILAGESMNAIVTDFNRRGVTATNGGPWVVTTLRQTISAPRIAGFRVHRGAVVGKGTWDAIVTEEQHERIKATLAARKQTRRTRQGSYLLSGKLRCGNCGSTLHSAFRSDGSGDRRYMCQPGPGRTSCGKLAVTALAVEALVAEAVKDSLSGSKMTRARTTKSTPAAGDVIERIHRLEGQLVQLGLDHDAGLVSRAEWLARRTPLSERLAQARGELTPMAANSAALDDFKDVPDVSAVWESRTLEQKRAVIDRIFESITVNPATKRGRGFDLERVVWTWRV